MSAPINLYQPSELLDKLNPAILTDNSLVSSVDGIRQAFYARLERKRRRARILALSGLSLWLVAFGLFGVFVLPQTMYKFFPEYTDRVATALGQTAQVERSGFGDELYQEQKVVKPLYAPAYDPSLPDGNWLIIDKIGINTPIREAIDWEEALRYGVWRAYQFATPDVRDDAVVLAAHRFGYLSWSNTYRRTNSFFNLPKLEVGDQIQLVWEKRLYTYEVYEGYTDTVLRDFDADLILFTCEVLNSDRRIIRKARLLVPEEFRNN